MLKEKKRARSEVRFDGVQEGTLGMTAIEGIANVVEERSEEEFLVPGVMIAGELEDLEGVVEEISFGVATGIESNGFEILEIEAEVIAQLGVIGVIFG